MAQAITTFGVVALLFNLTLVVASIIALIVLIRLMLVATTYLKNKMSNKTKDAQ